MELVRNKASGKYFIVLDDDTRSTEFLVITSEGMLKRLERHLFEPHNAIDPEDTLWVHNLTKIQMDKYEEYLDE